VRVGAEAGQGKNEPPITNRGVEVTRGQGTKAGASALSFSIHWLTGTTYLPEDDVLGMLSQLLDGSDYVILDYGVNRYRKTYLTLGGIKVLVNPGDPDTMPPVCVIVPGQGCEILGTSKLQELAKILKPTRVDFAFDGAPFTPGELLEHFEAGNVRTRVRRDAFEWCRNKKGTTLYLGSRASTWHMCAYDERGWTRLELRLTGERAEKTYQALTGDTEQLKFTALGWLREFCDFVDRSREANASRAPLLPTWQTFVEGIERVSMRLAGNVAPTIERVVQWIEHQVSATLATYCKLGHSVQTLLGMGNKRMTGKHRALLIASGAS
jgi:hypothetical protein